MLHFIWREILDMFQKALLMPLWTFGSDYGNESNTLFLSWHNPVYGSSAHGILVRLGDLEGKSI